MYRWQRVQPKSANRLHKEKMMDLYGCIDILHLSQRDKALLLHCIQEAKRDLVSTIKRRIRGFISVPEARGIFFTHLRTRVQKHDELRYCAGVKSYILNKSNWDHQGNFVMTRGYSDPQRVSLDETLLGQSTGDPAEETIRNINRSLVLMEAATQELRAVNSESEIVLTDMRRANLIT